MRRVSWCYRQENAQETGSLFWCSEVVKLKKEKWIEEQEGGEDIYSDEGRENMLENDELDPYEAAFMQGYDAA